MSLNRFYIDGSSLSPEDKEKVTNLVMYTANNHSVITGKNCSYEAFWNDKINPATDIHFPDGCIIKQIK